MPAGRDILRVACDPGRIQKRLCDPAQITSARPTYWALEDRIPTGFCLAGKRTWIPTAPRISTPRTKALPSGPTGPPVIHVGPWKEEVFSNAGYEAVVNAIAATSSGELEIFAADRLPERLAVFEEFANGGLAELQKEMRVGTNALDAVRSLMMEAQVLADEKKAPDIQKIARDLSW
jgi:hypothetical protein